MPELSGIYDSFALQPGLMAKQNVALLTLGKYEHYMVKFVEGIPPGPASTVEMVANAGATSLAAGGTLNRAAIVALQLYSDELLRLRWEPLDNVEGLLWELSGTVKLASRNIHARVDRATRLRDPSLATTTFWIWSQNRDMNLEVRNPMARATPMARFIFWGWRFKLEANPAVVQASKDAAIKTKLEDGDLATVRQVVGATAWIPAEGMR